MRIRIYRTWTWELACSPREVQFGGKNPMKLVAHDKLQYQNPPNPKWYDIDIEEEAKPERP